jgi:hypothetical protein
MIRVFSVLLAYGAAPGTPIPGWRRSSPRNPKGASMAPRVAGMVTWRPYASVNICLAVPGQPIRSLVAEDQSAGGVRDWAGQ